MHEPLQPGSSRNAWFFCGGLQGSRPGQGSAASSSLVCAADDAGQGVFRTFPRGEKCGVRSALGVGTAPRVEPIHAGGSRRKRKLPKAGGRPVLGQGGCRARCCATTGFGEPVVCQRHRPWTSWRRFRLCVSSWSRSWCANATDHGGFRRAADHGGNHGGDVIVQRQVLGETEQKTEEVPQFRSHGVVQFLDKVVDTPPGVQRQVLGSDCRKPWCFCSCSSRTGLSRVSFEPSMFVIEGFLGVALTPGVLLLGVRPPVDATISG